eukprot:Gb_13092 [translate_table: standard]
MMAASFPGVGSGCDYSRRDSLGWQDHSNTSGMSRHVGSELSCTNAKGSSIWNSNSEQCGYGEVSSSQTQTCKSPDLNLSLWVSTDCCLKGEQPESHSHSPNSGGMEVQRRQNIDITQNAMVGSKRRYYEADDDFTHVLPFGINHCKFSQEKQDRHQSTFELRHDLIDNGFAAAGHHSTSTRGQAVGWPPIRAYRRNSGGSHSKLCGDEREGLSAVSSVQNQSNSLYVKVKMDGVAIGRKVDLSAHESYEALAQELEEMFQRTTDSQTGSQISMGKEHGIASDIKTLRLLDPASDFLLAYEDKEGDCMLVGDVPWRMFGNTVKRLRIIKTVDTNVLGMLIFQPSRFLSKMPNENSASTQDLRNILMKRKNVADLDQILIPLLADMFQAISPA